MIGSVERNRLDDNYVRIQAPPVTTHRAIIMHKGYGMHKVICWQTAQHGLNDRGHY